MKLSAKISVSATSAFQVFWSFRNAPGMLRPLVYRFTRATVNLRADSKEVLLEKPWANGSCLHPATEGVWAAWASAPPHQHLAVQVAWGQRERVTVKGRESWSWCWLLTTVVPGGTCVGATWHVCSVCTQTKCSSTGPGVQGSALHSLLVQCDGFAV